MGRRWTVDSLARRAGVSRWTVYLVERGDPTSVEAVTRVTDALGLRLEAEIVDPRKRQPLFLRPIDPVHSLMGEFEVGHIGGLGCPTAVDEPYQHYQFAGRADVLAWNVDARELLHIENRTRFPDFQEMAGSFNAKRAYLGKVMAERLEVVGGWRSEVHVIAALWSSEVLHALRMRTASFRSLCPDSPDGFAAWWSGTAQPKGRRSELIVLDPRAAGRQRVFVGLDDALTIRPRYRGYAEVARLLTSAA